MLSRYTILSLNFQDLKYRFSEWMNGLPLFSADDNILYGFLYVGGGIIGIILLIVAFFFLFVWFGSRS